MDRVLDTFLELVRVQVQDESDVLLLSYIQEGLVRSVSDRDDPYYTSCARVAYGRPDILLESFLVKDRSIVKRLLRDVPECTDVPDEHTDGHERMDPSACTDVLDHDPGQECAGADVWDAEVHSTSKPVKTSRSIERRRRRIKRVIADNLKDSFF